MDEDVWHLISNTEQKWKGTKCKKKYFKLEIHNTPISFFDIQHSHKQL